jgi:hypothetical protein
MGETEPRYTTLPGGSPDLAYELQRQGKLDKPVRARRTTPRHRCVAWLRERLAAGPVPADLIRTEAAAHGFSEKTLFRAKRELRIPRGRRGFGPGGAFIWQLPPPIAAEPTRRKSRRVPRPGAIGKWAAAHVPMTGVPLSALATRAAVHVPPAVCEHRKRTAAQVAEQEIRRTIRRGELAFRKLEGVAYVFPPPDVMAARAEAVRSNERRKLALIEYWSAWHQPPVTGTHMDVPVIGRDGYPVGFRRVQASDDGWNYLEQTGGLVELPGGVIGVRA